MPVPIIRIIHPRYAERELPVRDRLSPIAECGRAELQSYQYDAAGNTLRGGKSYTYNDRNRLVSATANGATTDYQHNALGQRVVKGSGTDQTHYVCSATINLSGQTTINLTG